MQIQQHFCDPYHLSASLQSFLLWLTVATWPKSPCDQITEEKSLRSQFQDESQKYFCGIKKEELKILDVEKHM